MAGADDLNSILIAREGDRRDALVASDKERFADILADDLVHVHTTGIVQTKGEVIGHATGFLEFLDIERGPLTIRSLAPDVAVMTGPMTNIVRRRGIDERVAVQAFVTQVWAKRQDRWQIVSFHAVRTPESEPQS